MPGVLDLTQPAGQIIVIVFFLIPGLNATWVMERLEGRTTLGATERLFRAVSWSVLIYLGASGWLFDAADRLSGQGEISPKEITLIAGLLIFAAPVALALGMVWVRRRRWFRSLISRLTSIHPAPTAWDFAFAPSAPHFVRVKLRSGELIGGFYAGRSFASAFPEPQDLFLEQAWSLDESGGFVQPISRTQGVLLRPDTIDRVEFLSTTEGDHGDQGQDQDGTP